MRLVTYSAALLGVASLLALPAAIAAERVQVVTSFSILADMVENVGGDHVAVTSLVGADGDTHVYSPSPRDAQAVAEADLVVFNGLQFEGWMERLIDASDHDGLLVIATEGVERLSRGQAHDDHAHDDDHSHDDEHGHDEHASHDDHGDDDPHAWQDLAMGKVYVVNIRDGLMEADPDNSDAYTENAERYLQAIEATHAEIRERLTEIPPDTSVITGHDSFGYFANAYGLRFLSPVGLSTEGDASAADMARLIDVIREENVGALFHENMTSPAMIEQLAEETGLPIAGTLYADALASEGDASTWLGMMRHNAEVLHEALAAPGHSPNDDHAHGDDDHDH
ncbi:zinc ABC transporter substrate-binding protein [Halomonas sp. TRM85114]|uniref:metal ABC transporter solute-binding protein, Zn/Mn family n=1 Tax=Halomonas jincaotanensis TaxID=2810616 RepID=UPI001BD4ABAA|nr:zinc ABC transporter substrate-binding protein [Halomonas jincaotanensis]MBS9403492.1 zinc ABC transporter substrate-binding protein [Halomonas jincaotanensis]